MTNPLSSGVRDRTEATWLRVLRESAAAVQLRKMGLLLAVLIGGALLRRTSLHALQGEKILVVWQWAVVAAATHAITVLVGMVAAHEFLEIPRSIARTRVRGWRLLLPKFVALVMSATLLIAVDGFFSLHGSLPGPGAPALDWMTTTSVLYIAFVHVGVFFDEWRRTPTVFGVWSIILSLPIIAIHSIALVVRLAPVNGEAVETPPASLDMLADGVTAMKCFAITFPVLTAVYLFAIFFLIRQRKDQARHRRGAVRTQLRLAKAAIVCPVAAAVSMLLAYALGADSYSATVEHLVRSEEPANVERLFVSLAQLGLLWFASVPAAVLSVLLVGSLFVQDIPGRQWQAQRSLGSGRHGSWGGMGPALSRCVDDLSMITLALTAIVNRLPLQFFAGVAINGVFSVSPIFILSLLASEPAGAEALHGKLSPVHGVVLVNLWLASALAWITPLGRIVTDLGAVLHDRLAIEIRQSLDRCRDHFVIAGFGDLGRRVSLDLFKRGILSQGVLNRAVTCFNSSGERISLLKNVVIIDQGTTEFEGVTRTAFGQEGIVRLPDLTAGPGEDPVVYYAIGVEGNIADNDVTETARTRHARTFLSLVRDTEAGFEVEDYLRYHSKKDSDVRSIVAAGTSSQVSYLTYRSVRYPVSRFHLTQLRADALGSRVADALMACRSMGTVRRADPNQGCMVETSPVGPTSSPRLRVLLIGSGEEALYTVDSTVRQYSERGAGQGTLQIGILAMSEELSKRRLPGDLHPRTGEWPGQEFVDAGWRVLDFGIHAETPSRAGSRIATATVIHKNADPAALKPVESALDLFLPDLVIINDVSTVGQLRIARCVLQILGKRAVPAGQEALPRVIIGVETGVQGRATNMGDAARYYSAIFGRTSSQSGDRSVESYPRQFGYADHQQSTLIGDSLVDVLDDPAIRITATVRAHLEDSPFESSLCIDNYPGALSELLARASRLERFDPSSIEQAGPPPVSASPYLALSSSRMWLDTSQQFIATSSCSLVDLDTTQPVGPQEIKRGVYFGLGANVVEGKLGPQGQVRTNVDVAWNSVFPESAPIPGREMIQRSCWKDGCPDMHSCQVSMYSKHVEAQSMTHPQAGEPFFVRAGGGNADERRRAPVRERAAEGRLFLITDEGSSAGTLAKLFNGLVFHGVRTSAHSEGERDVLNVTYLSDETCYGSHHSVVSMSGYLSPEADMLASAFPLNCLLIRPSMGELAWEGYLNRLAVFLTRTYSVQCQVDKIVRQSYRAPGEEQVLVLALGIIDPDRIESGSPLKRWLENRQDPIAGQALCIHKTQGRTVCRICRELESATGGLTATGADWTEIKHRVIA